MTVDPVSPSDSIQPDFGRWQILVVSDSAVEKKLLSGLLTKHQHHPVVASGARDALAKWSTTAFDAVIVDPFLSDVPGSELIRAIRDSGQAGRVIPIIVMSGDMQERALCVAAGGDACLQRPLPIAEFHHLVVEARQRVRDAQSASRPLAHADESPDPAPDSIDWTVAMDAVGGRRDLLEELIQIFEAEYPTTFAAIRTAIEQDDAKSLHVSAHNLKGCLRYFGPTTAGNLARDLEELGRSGTTRGAASQLAPLDAAVRRLLPLLRQGPGNG